MTSKSRPAGVHPTSSPARLAAIERFARESAASVGLRELAAIAAMQTLIGDKANDYINPRETARIAVEYADELVDALAESRGRPNA
ncbi:MAG: hypothetical protein U1F54_23030 [Burkholderiales bacterium]